MERVGRTERTEREKASVREFLRYLGIDFREDELHVPAKDGDVDVQFRDARFQNVERMDAGRRHQDVRQLAERVRTTGDLLALEVRRGDSVPMRVAELLREVLKALENKSRKTVNRASLDALVHINLGGRHLHPGADVIEVDTRGVAQLGWRSVSMLWPPYASVVCAKPSAPRFLRVKAGHVVRYSAIPWEGGERAARAASIAAFASAVVGNLAVPGYVVLGGVVLAVRALRDLVGAVAARCSHEASVGEIATGDLVGVLRRFYVPAPSRAVSSTTTAFGAEVET